MEMLLFSKELKTRIDEAGNPRMSSFREPSFCTGCGTCIGICSQKALKIRRSLNGLYYPVLESSRCDGCGLCTKVCPGISVDLRPNRSGLGSGSVNKLIGPFIKCYVGHSTDENIRYESSSGGLATELAAFALESKMVDGVLVTKMNSEAPLEPIVFVAHRREELIEASKSKYCPVPLNASLQEMVRCHEKLAIIGLPCHIHGLEKAKSVVGELRSRIVLSIGLFCSHTITFNGTEFLLEKFGIRKDEVTNLSYRGKGWPPRMTIELKGGGKVEVPSIAYWGPFFSNFFIPMRCTTCPDFANELADISVGDAWLPKFLSRNQGESIVVTRSRKGQNLLLEAIARNRVNVESISYNDVIESSKGSIYYKKKGLIARTRFLRTFGYKIPEIKSSCPEPSFASYIVAAMTFLNIYVSSNRKTLKLLRYLPHSILMAYSRMISQMEKSF